MNSQAPLTIALVLGTPGTTWGGMEKHTEELAEALAERGHQVHIIAHRTFSERFPRPLHFHPCPVQLGRKNPWLWLKLARLVRRIRPDILHAQGNKAASLISHVRTFFPCSTIGTIHGIKSNERAFAGCSALIAVSRSVYDRLNHPARKLIYNGIKSGQDLGELSAPPRLDEKNRTINVLAVGRLVPVKGFDTLIRAWKPVVDALPQSHLTILGEGEQRHSLEKLVAELVLGEHVALPGHQNNTAPWYSNSDLTVISSRREGFSYVLLEALMAGCPVISTPVSGPQELLPPEAITRDHSPSSLAELLISSLRHLTDLRDKEQPSMRRVRIEFTVTAMAEQTEKVYLEVLWK
ncbi:glycosyltransferase involved in cell wall biosynthesis [Marinobacter pelagius]|uniref:Glycosyltransferase involved in cell wall biosynthesis n=1 Tax=Marinobacter pelagius TaxID=379482 RepID=A0A366GPD8_9GAMM|nr:glycosyltransferase [Marinobacter pelagius]RBP29130.1 glycosyltransferase involved in cell wall biosynthesis [Marinobacter pelagius]